MFTKDEAFIGGIILGMFLLMVLSSCQSRYYPPAPKYEGYVLK